MRDFQRQKVYDWESNFVSPRDAVEVPFDQIQPIVNYVWDQEGLRYPPQVVEMPKQVKRACADACREQIRFKPRARTFVILHELAHSMTAIHEGEVSMTNMHGEDFVGMYMQLLDRHLRIPLCESMFTASKAGVKFNTAVRPYCLD